MEAAASAEAKAKEAKANASMAEAATVMSGILTTVMTIVASKGRVVLARVEAEQAATTADALFKEVEAVGAHALSKAVDDEGGAQHRSSY